MLTLQGCRLRTQAVDPTDSLWRESVQFFVARESYPELTEDCIDGGWDVNGHAGTLSRHPTNFWGRFQSAIYYHLHAKNPSSSSRLLGAGSGAPGASCVGSLTYPLSPKGFRDCNLDSMGVVEDVFAGTSGSRRDQPMEFIESRNEVDAILVLDVVEVVSD